MADQKSILISGAGIAGPTVAYWLCQYGFSVTIVEIAPDLRPGGQAVDLRGAGRTVIDRMGLMSRARDVSLNQRGLAWVDARGRHRAEMSVDAFGGNGIISETEILRGDLTQLLYDATAADAEYLFDTRITELEQHSDGVRVRLSDGSTREFDLVIGADGPHSATRRLAFGPEQAFVKPIGGYNAWFSAPDQVGLEDWYLMYNAPGGRVASMRPGREPGTAKAALAFASTPIPYDRRDLTAQRNLLIGRFAGLGWAVPAMLTALRQADDFYFDALVQIQLPSWSSGRVVLVGDAGYCPSPLTGLGTSLGLVGAYVLAGELAAADGDHQRAFARYEEILRPYVAQGQELPGAGIKSYAPQSELGIRMGHLFTRLMVSRLGSPIAHKMFFSKADAIELPDYAAG